MSNSSPAEPSRYRWTERDEISLYDLYRVLVRRKNVVLSVLVASLLVAAAYAISTRPTYEAKVRLIAPTSDSLFLSRPAHSLATVNSTVVFNQFYTAIQSGQKWAEFVEGAAKAGVAADELRGSVSVKASAKLAKSKDASVDSLEIVYQTPHAKSAADTLRNYLKYSVEQFNSSLAASVRDRVEREKEVIASEIALLRQKAKLQRADEIERLRQDIGLAESLGITKYLLLCPDDSERNEGSVIAASQTIPTYMRGSIALHAELEQLQRRESDDAYIIGLRDKQTELDRLGGLQMSVDEVLPYMQVDQISASAQPTKPNKKLAFILGAGIGLLAGVLAAFLIEGIVRGKAESVS